MNDGAPHSPGERSTSSSAPIETRYDWTETPPSAAVVQTLAIATNERPTDLSPLYPDADPDALDTLIGPDTGPVDGSTVECSFTYEGFEVTVASEGTVTVTRQRGVTT